MKLFIDATEATHTFLHSMGSRVAMHKSIVFSSHDNTRTTLRKHIWTYNNDRITVTNNFRGLGAHVNLAASAHSTTLNHRLIKGTFATVKLSKLPLSHHDKAKHIRGKCIPLAIYGAEAS